MGTIHPLHRDQQPAAPAQAPQPQQNIRLLALSNNHSVLEMLQRALPSGITLSSLQQSEHLLEHCRSQQPGILVLDTASGVDIQRLSIQLLQDLPESVLVVIGGGNDSAALMKLAAAGHIYRFLLTPLAHGQTRLTLEAALAQHQDLKAATERRSANETRDDATPRKNYLPTYLGLGAALILVVGGVFYGLSRMGADSTVTTAATPADSAGITRELALADAALAAGKLLEPPGDSALDLYRNALSMDASNPRAKAGIDAVASKILEQAEAALSAEQLELAVTALEQARDVSPDNSRLKFLDGQVARERERLKLTQASDLGKKVRGLLADAQEDMDAGRLVAPAGNNARDALLEARRLDPTDPSVSQSLRSLNARLIDAARRATEQGQTDSAQALVSSARQLGFAGADLSTLERNLSESRNKTGNSTAETQLAAAQKAAEQAQAERDAALAAAAAAQKEKVAAQAAAEAAAAQASKAAPPPVALKRTKTVSPKYPSEAMKRNVSGWVEVSFTVKEDGGVTNVRAVDAEPKEVFDFAAIQAVEQWRFEPPMRDGKPTTQSTKVRLRFDIPK